MTGSGGPVGHAAPADARATAALEAILAFLAREQAAGNRDYAELCARSPADRVATGHSLGPLTFLGEGAGGRLRFRLEADDSRFREGERGLLGPAATGEEAISRGFAVSYATFDHSAGELLLEPDRFARGPRPPLDGDLYLDPAKFDLTDLYVSAARAVLTPSISPLAECLLFDRPTATDESQQELLFEIAGTHGLNPSQRRAFASAATTPISLVQGPPGTGKTHVLAAVVSHLLAGGRRVLLCAVAHRAVNNALAACARVAPAGAQLVKLSDEYQGLDLPPEVELADRANAVAVRLQRDGPLLVGTSVAKIPGLVNACGAASFDAVVFDEAGQLTLPQALCGALAAPRAFFFGDHRQLPPIFNADHDGHEWGLGRSAFEMLSDRHDSHLLTVSYRLNDELVAFPSAAYYEGRLRASARSKGNRLKVTLPSDDPLSPILDPAHPLVWVEVPHHFRRAPCPEEAEVASGLISLALRAGLTADQVAVLSPYRAQNQAIRSRLREISASAPAGSALAAAGEVVVDTVERMQGQECDLIIYSLALSDPLAIEQQADFFHMPNRLNVAITRARAKCVILANPVLLTHRTAAAPLLRGLTTLRRVRALSCVLSAPTLVTS